MPEKMFGRDVKSRQAVSPVIGGVVAAQRQPLKKGMYGLLSHPGSVRLSHHINITAGPTI